MANTKTAFVDRSTSNVVGDTSKFSTEHYTVLLVHFLFFFIYILPYSEYVLNILNTIVQKCLFFVQKPWQYTVYNFTAIKFSNTISFNENYCIRYTSFITKRTRRENGWRFFFTGNVVCRRRRKTLKTRSRRTKYVYTAASYKRIKQGIRVYIHARARLSLWIRLREWMFKITRIIVIFYRQ